MSTQDTAMPKGLTRGYSNWLADVLKATAAKVLTIQELKDLDDAELDAEIERTDAIAVPMVKVKWEDDTDW